MGDGGMGGGRKAVTNERGEQGGRGERIAGVSSAVERCSRGLKGGARTTCWATDGPFFFLCAQNVCRVTRQTQRGTGAAREMAGLWRASERSWGKGGWGEGVEGQRPGGSHCRGAVRSAASEGGARRS